MILNIICRRQLLLWLTEIQKYTFEIYKWTQFSKCCFYTAGVASWICHQKKFFLNIFKKFLNNNNSNKTDKENVTTKTSIWELNFHHFTSAYLIKYIFDVLEDEINSVSQNRFGDLCPKTQLSKLPVVCCFSLNA